MPVGEALTPEGLLGAFCLDGSGGGEPLGWDGLARQAGDGGFVWIHLQGEAFHARQWLIRDSGLDPLVVDALLATDIRPRCTEFDGGTLVVLRGINADIGNSPKDMVSIQAWISPGRVISVRRNRIAATRDMRAEIARQRAPRTVGALLADLAGRLTGPAGGAVAALEDSVDALDEAVAGGRTRDLSADVGDLRRRIISIRRHIAPLREALRELQTIRGAPLGDDDRGRLEEVADHVVHYVDDLDSLRDRTAVIHDELAARRSEQFNRNLYLMTLIASIFLPLTLFAGLLGANVGGIPWGQSPWGFVAICAVCGLLGAGEIWLFRKLGWL